jgi:hypothetical protein
MIFNVYIIKNITFQTFSLPTSLGNAGIEAKMLLKMKLKLKIES